MIKVKVDVKNPKGKITLSGSPVVIMGEMSVVVKEICMAISRRPGNHRTAKETLNSIARVATKMIEEEENK